jgi:methyl-accepting chemotaxis protein
MLRTHAPHPHHYPRPKKWRTQQFVVRRFQYRYAFFLASFGFLLSLLVGGVTLYLLNNNYQLLMDAQLLIAPKVVDHLTLELKLANEVIITSFVGFIFLMGFLGIKFSHRLVIPIYLIQEKMRDVCRGNLFDTKVFIRKTDEFQEFAETYNYMIESMRTQLKSDLNRLDKLRPDDHNRDAIHTWERMTQEKSLQLNGDDVSVDPAPYSRHAS